MNIVIKVTDKEVIVGDKTDNSVKRIPLANTYDGIQSGDSVELFGDGTTYFLSKLTSFDSSVIQKPLTKDNMDAAVERNSHVPYSSATNSQTFEAMNDRGSTKDVENLTIKDSDAIGLKLEGRVNEVVIDDPKQGEFVRESNIENLVESNDDRIGDNRNVLQSENETSEVDGIQLIAPDKKLIKSSNIILYFAKVYLIYLLAVFVILCLIKLFDVSIYGATNNLLLYL